MASWRWCLTALAGWVLASGIGLAQDGPAQLYEDVKVLTTVHRLGLTPEQMQKLLGALDALSEQRQALAALRARTWEEHREDIETVNQAWLKGEGAPSMRKRAADRAIQKLRQAESDLAAAEVAAAEELRDDLTEEQRRLIQTEAQAQQRRQLQQRLGGAATVGEFLANELEQIRDLMPDEYQRVRTARARRIARRVLARSARNLDAFAGQILAIMDEVISWSAEKYGEQRESLPAQISSNLGLEEQQPTEQMVTYEQLLALAKSERAAALLTSCLEASQGGGEQ